MSYYMRTSNTIDFEHKKEEAMKQLKYFEIIEGKPPIAGVRKAVPKALKIQIWNKSRPFLGFNPEHFRQDALGNVCVKGLSTYRKFDERSKLAYHYEHILSHSHGGQVETGNLCLLNA